LDGAAVIAVGIITAPRTRPTIEKSIRSFFAAGFTDTHVFAEPGSEVFVPKASNITVHVNVSKRGNFKNWVHALGSLLALSTDDWLMVCEDDISWAAMSREVLENDLSKFKREGNRAGGISLYCPIRMSKVLEREYANGRRLTQGWYGARIGRSTWGAQCMVFNREWARELLADKILLAFLADPRWDKNVDALVAETINRKGQELVYRIPCLVDHTFGDGNSSLGYKPDRPELKTKYFAG
jgi:hypothetical protein